MQFNIYIFHVNIKRNSNSFLSNTHLISINPFSSLFTIQTNISDLREMHNILYTHIPHNIP